MKTGPGGQAGTSTCGYLSDEDAGSEIFENLPDSSSETRAACAAVKQWFPLLGRGGAHQAHLRGLHCLHMRRLSAPPADGGSVWWVGGPGTEG